MKELEIMMQGMSEERKQAIRDRADELEKEFQKSAETGKVDMYKMKIRGDIKLKEGWDGKKSDEGWEL